MTLKPLPRTLLLAGVVSPSALAPAHPAYYRGPAPVFPVTIFGTNLKDKSK